MSGSKFFGDEREENTLPSELHDEILMRFTPRQLIMMRSTTKKLRARIDSQAQLLAKKLFSKSFEEFITRTNSLPAYMKKDVLDGTTSLPVAEILAMPSRDRANALLSQEELKKFYDLRPTEIEKVKALLGDFFATKEVVIAVVEKLVSPAELRELAEKFYAIDSEPPAFSLFTSKGITALRHKYITLHEANAMTDIELEGWLSRDLALLRQRHQFIMDPDNLKKLKVSNSRELESRLKALISEKQELVVRRLVSLTTMEFLQKYPHDDLKTLLSRANITVSSDDLRRANIRIDGIDSTLFASILIEKLATPLELIEVFRRTGSDRLRSEMIVALREGLITMPEFLLVLDDYAELLDNNAALLRARHKFLTNVSDWKEAGVASKEEFQQRFKQLPLEYQQEIMKKVMTLPIAETMIKRFNELDDKVKIVFQAAKFSLQEQKELLLAPPDNFMKLLKEKVWVKVQELMAQQSVSGEKLDPAIFMKKR